MRIERIDEAHDIFESFDIVGIKKEGEAIVVVTPSFTFLIVDGEEFLDAAIDAMAVKKP